MTTQELARLYTIKQLKKLQSEYRKEGKQANKNREWEKAEIALENMSMINTAIAIRRKKRRKK